MLIGSTIPSVMETSANSSINLLGDLNSIFDNKININSGDSNILNHILSNTVDSQNSSIKEVFKNSEIMVSYQTINRTENHTNVFVSNLTDKVLNNVKINFLVPKYLTLKVLQTYGTHLTPLQVNGIKKVFIIILGIYCS